MKKILLVYSPFCTPASPPYSVTAIHAFLKRNLDEDHDIKISDLNARFHNTRFAGYKEYCQRLADRYDREEYDAKTKQFIKETAKKYSENNKKVTEGKEPELIEELSEEITSKKPDIAAFSIVYSSQAFYTYAIIKKLKEKGIKTVIGGPAVNSILKKEADAALRNEAELLNYIRKTENTDYNSFPDFSTYNKKDYFTPSTVTPLKTSSTCYYRRCTFCTHYSKETYIEYGLEKIKETIKKSGSRNFFLIDDMIHRKRLLEIAKIMKEANANWTCQLRPTKELDYETLKELRKSGLKMIMWGIESGNDRILKLINKGTNTKDIKKVIYDSHKAGIKNIAYIIFGFPTEKKEEFLDTIRFLEENKDNIDLVSTSIFGLQKGTRIYENPSEFGITKITEEKRTILEPTISYEVKEGLSNEEARKLRQKYKKTIEKINKYPKTMNYFREHMLLLC